MVLKSILFMTVYLVESLQVTNGWGDHLVIRKFVLQVGDEHAKLSAPVSKVINPHNIMADPFKQTADTFSNNCRPTNIFVYDIILTECL